MAKLSKKEKALAYDAEKLVEKFNELYPVGSTVMVRKIARESSPYVEYTVKAKAFLVNPTSPVAFFNGISGCFSIESCFVSYPF